jgi:hypothetical protein
LDGDENHALGLYLMARKYINNIGLVEKVLFVG